MTITGIIDLDTGDFVESINKERIASISVQEAADVTLELSFYSGGQVVTDASVLTGGSLNLTFSVKSTPNSDAGYLVNHLNADFAVTGSGLTRTATVDFNTAEVSAVLGSLEKIKLYGQVKTVFDSTTNYSQLITTTVHNDVIGAVGTTTPAIFPRLVTSTSDPGVTDDSGDGYGVGTLWINTNTDTHFILDDAAEGAAVWVSSLPDTGGTMTGALTVGQDGTGHDVKFFGDTSDKYLHWDQSEDKLILRGDFDVTGTTTTFNSTTVSIADPIFTLGGTDPPGLNDDKDRGIEFHYHDGSETRVGFFGYDDSANAFTFLTVANNSSEVFSGTAGTLHAQDYLAGSSGKFGWSGDADTYVYNLGDRIIFSVGGLGFADFKEGTQDIIHLNYNENQDIDFRVGYNGGVSIFSEGSSGNVGIGTAVPAQALSVEDGTIRVSHSGNAIAAMLGNSQLAFENYRGKLRGSGGLDFYLDGSGPTSGHAFDFRPNVAGTSHLAASSGEQAYVNVDAEAGQSGSANYVGLLVDATETSTGSGQDYLMDLRLAGTTRFNVTPAGKVGINCAVPSSLLDIRGDAGYPGILTLSTAETSVVASNQLGRIDFVAPLESSGTDSVKVGASITALAVSDFTDISNTTDLIFSTAISETATEKMRLTSDGYLKLNGTDSRFYAHAAVYFGESSNHGIINIGSSGYGLSVYCAGGHLNINAQSGAGLGWSSGHGSYYNTPDIVLARDAASILGLRVNGAAQELRIYSDLGDPAGNFERGSFAMDTSGDLTIATEKGGTGEDGDIIFSPAATEKMRLTSAGELVFLDGSSGSNNASFGTGKDLRLYHTGTNSHIYNTNGALYIQNAGAGGITVEGKAGERSVQAVADQGVKLYYDDALKFETTTGGTLTTGDASFTGSVAIAGGMTYTGVQAVTGSANLATTAYYCPVSTGGGAFTLTIPTAQHVVGRKIIVKDIDGSANTYNITITTEDPSSQTIDGNTTAVISTAKGYRELICTSSTTWHIIASDA